MKQHQNTFFVSQNEKKKNLKGAKGWTCGWNSQDHILSFWTLNIAFLLLVFLFSVCHGEKEKVCLNCYLSVYLLPFTIFFNNSIARMAFHGWNLNMTPSIFFNIGTKQIHCFVIIKVDTLILIYCSVLREKHVKYCTRENASHRKNFKCYATHSSFHTLIAVWKYPSDAMTATMKALNLLIKDPNWDTENLYVQHSRR